MTDLYCECRYETRVVSYMSGAEEESFRTFACVLCALREARADAANAAKKVEDLERRVAEKMRSKTAIGRAELAVEKAQAELERLRREEGK